MPIYDIRLIFGYLQAGGGDLSVISPPVRTSLTGMRQALHALEAGSPEVKRVLIDEANVVYECRVCLNMFRSLVNLLSHKRHYCRRRYGDVRHEFADQKRKSAGSDGVLVPDAVTTVLIEPEPVADCCLTNPDSWGGDLTTYSPSMELIKTAGILEELHQPQLMTITAPDRRKTLNAILPRLSGRPQPPPPSSVVRHNLTVRLEPVYNTSNALYQSWHLTDDVTGARLPSVKDINMSLQRIVIADNHTVVGPDGRAVGSGPAVTNNNNNNNSNSSNGNVVAMGENSVGKASQQQQQEQTDARKGGGCSPL